MCLAVPCRVVEIHDDGTATVDNMGVKRRVSVELIEEELKVGDYVLVHVGFAIQKLVREEALGSIELIHEIFKGT